MRVTPERRGWTTGRHSAWWRRAGPASGGRGARDRRVRDRLRTRAWRRRISAAPAGRVRSDGPTPAGAWQTVRTGHPLLGVLANVLWCALAASVLLLAALLAGWAVSVNALLALPLVALAALVLVPLAAAWHDGGGAIAADAALPADRP